MVISSLGVVAYTYRGEDPVVEELFTSNEIPVATPTYAPKILNVFPDQVVEGEVIDIGLVTSDPDTALDEVESRLIFGPSWLKIAENRLYGVADVGTSNVQRYTIELNDGTNITRQTFYIFVVDNE